MTPDQEADYKEAKRRIDEATDVLSLARLSNLTELPPEISTLTALKSLSLSETQVADLNPLESLKELQTLYLHNTQVADLSPLQSLTALQDLDLGNTQVADLSLLRSLTALQSLNFNNTQVANLSPLQNFTALQELYLADTPVADFTALRSLTVLRSLNLNNTQIANLSPIQSLTALQFLFLNNTQVADLSALQPLTALRYLFLKNTKVADVSPLRSLTALKHLELDKTQVSGLTPVKSLTALKYLSLGNTQVADLSQLQSFTELQTLFLDNTQVADLSPLKSLTALQNLYLGGTQVADLTPLQSLTALRGLGLTNTKVADLTPLRHHQALQSLSVNGTKVADLRPILTWPTFKPAAEDKDKAFGLWLEDSAATETDPGLAKIAEENEFKPAKRALLTLDHLATLPPWPEPLPWEVKEEHKSDETVTEPPKNATPRFAVNEDEKVSLQHADLTEEDRSDPLKRRMYKKLADAVQDLVRKGNQYPDVARPASALADMLAQPFEGADLLDIHIEIAVLTDLIDLDPERDSAEKLDADCLAALRKATRLGPPLTLDNPDVELFEARNLAYAEKRKALAEAEAERIIARALAKDPHLDERAQHFAELAALAVEGGRTATYRSSYVKNAIIFLGSGVAAGALGAAGGDLFKWAAEVVYLNKDAIMAVAHTWGATGHQWAADILVRAKAILDQRQ